MIVVVLDEPQYKAWMSGKKTFKDGYMAAIAAPAAPADGTDSTAVTQDTVSLTMN